MRILILVFSDVSRDPRVMRQIRALQPKCDLTVAGFGPQFDSGISFMQIGKRRRSNLWKILAFITLFLGFFRLYYWYQIEYPRRARHNLFNQQYDVILANDVNTLPLAFSISSGNCQIFLDTHEFSPCEFSGLVWKLSIGRLNHWICRRWLSKVDLMSSVCTEIGDLYTRDYGKTVDFITYNVPSFCQDIESPIPLNEKKDDLIRLVHHGSAEPSRHIELMVQMLDLLDSRFVLDLVLVGHESSYARSLINYTSSKGRLRILPPFGQNEIVSSLKHYDMGLYLLSPTSPNNYYAMPNKLFDFIQAGLAIAVGPSPAMANLVRKEHLGIVSNDFTPDSLAQDLNSMSMSSLISFKHNSRTCRFAYTSEVAEQEIFARVSSLVNA